MHQIVTKQKAFFNTNATKNISFRIEQLQKLEKVLKKNEQLLNEAIFNDFKKSEFENYATELGIIYSEINTACKKLHKWASTKKVTTNFLNFPGKSYIIPEPLGVTLIIGAWNYPYQLSISPAISAIAAGNTVILKPSEISIATSALLTKIINNTFDPAIFTVVEGGIPETTELLNEKFDKIFFTGSTTIGKIVYKAAAKNLIPVTLELGGKSPAIIDKTCNLKICVKRLVWAKFLNAGQTCIAPDYVCVDASIKSEFLKQLTLEINASNFKIENSNYVQIINKKNMKRLVSLIDPEKIYLGGLYNFEENSIDPTILTDVSFYDTIMEDEIFGPILPIITYKNIDEIITQIKLKPKPLACYIFSNSTAFIKKIEKEISFGSGAINDAIMQISNENLPFGGVGHSGIGSYHGEYGFKTFSHYKSILKKSTWFEPNLKYFPLTDLKLKIIKFLMHFKL
ncbi:MULTISPECIES: aldehyde dehydrogenase [Flavobacteriaceae]|uniref:Aldehyde dehydrogenase n=2 Tax=Flavobacteriaceae TaxID=49546 RepID=A0A4Y8AST5_9FLAO|nr:MULTISPECIES: aldehyde dehydrogenase [Flavobacteriaceae]TEW74937.1 aldehyde dehydrogenase [Gramella jeungdoensis]GGK42912.1 aldehyde dehydrogenase [Lutibacter litoralis]